MCDKFHTILVRGGYTGTKLHKASNGSSSLQCGHWTRAHVCNFQEADNVDPETIEAFKKQGAEFCEKCFPELANDEKKQTAYTGPKTHIARGRIVQGDDGLKVRRFKGSGCGRNPDYTYNFLEFRKALNERPESICKGCERHYNELTEQARKMKKV